MSSITVVLKPLVLLFVVLASVYLCFDVCFNLIFMPTVSVSISMLTVSTSGLTAYACIQRKVISNQFS